MSIYKLNKFLFVWSNFCLIFDSFTCSKFFLTSSADRSGMWRRKQRNPTMTSQSVENFTNGTQIPRRKQCYWISVCDWLRLPFDAGMSSSSQLQGQCNSAWHFGKIPENQLIEKKWRTLERHRQRPNWWQAVTSFGASPMLHDGQREDRTISRSHTWHGF